MPELIYCDACQRMIPPGELEAGKAITSKRLALCDACVHSLSRGRR